ncbi:glycosyltransferase [Methylovorus sp. SPW-M1]
MKKNISILVLLPVIPFPPDDGGKIASYTFIEQLRNKYDFTVLMPSNNRNDVQNLSALKEHWKNVNILSTEAPHRNITWFFSRLVKKLFYILNRVIFKRSIFDDPHLLYPFLDCNPGYFHALKKIVDANHFDLIQVEYAQNLSLVNCLPSTIKKVYVEVESRYSLLADHTLIGNSDKSDYYNFIIENVKATEIALLAKYDAIISYSNDDQERLKKLLPEKPIYVSPLNLINDPVMIDYGREDFSVDKLVFIGHESHLPNKDAVEWFIEEILPKLSKFDIKFFVLGRWSKSFVSKFKHDNRVVFTGYVDDINSYIKNSINVVPIRLGGGGLRLKVLLSIGNGIPVVTTDKAAFGFGFSHGVNGMIANNPTEFSNAIASLLEDPKLASTLSKNAYNLYIENFSVQSTTHIRDEIYQNIARSPSEVG